MKPIVLIAALAVFAVPSAFAESKDQKNASEVTKTITGEKKTARKKKVLMCADCGKPETECTCPDAGKEYKDGHDHSKDKGEHKEH